MAVIYRVHAVDDGGRFTILFKDEQALRQWVERNNGDEYVSIRRVEEIAAVPVDVTREFLPPAVPDEIGGYPANEVAAAWQTIFDDAANALHDDMNGGGLLDELYRRRWKLRFEILANPDKFAAGIPASRDAEG